MNDVGSTTLCTKQGVKAREGKVFVIFKGNMVRRWSVLPTSREKKVPAPSFTMEMWADSHQW